MRMTVLWIAVVVGLAGTATLRAADNELTPEEKAAGWQLLFNGHDYTGWRCNNDRPIASKIEDASLVPHRSGGYLIIYDKQFGDFVLKCDVKMDKECNSGVFFRVGKPHNPVQTGFEVQVSNEIEDAGPNRPNLGGKGSGRAERTSYHDFGAIYDLVPPKKFDKPLSPDWNSITVTCKGPHIDVEVNGQHVADLNCDEWTTPHQNPDGRHNKFSKAIKDFPRTGYLGFQDHGHKVWFKNVKLLDLTGK
jgi:hypothetical protein